MRVSCDVEDEVLIESTDADIAAEIYAAFNGVTRQGGVSWTETGVLDDYGSDEERADAREQDQEATWHELLENPDWSPSVGWGGFSFLDSIGFRYYLAPAMILALERKSAAIAFFLTLGTTLDEEFLEDLAGLRLPTNEAMDAHTLEKWSRLNEAQRTSVARFLRHMALRNEQSEWREAYDSHWHQYDPEKN